MKKFLALALALSVGAAASPVMADPLKKADGAFASTASRGPVKMTDEQMDNVTAGQISIGEGLIIVAVQDAVDIGDVAINANVAAAVAVLGGAAASAVQQNVQFFPNG
jgi:hypothetical protein